MTSSQENPLGTEGFAFLIFTSPDPKVLADGFKQMGLTPVASAKDNKTLWYNSGEIYFAAEGQTNDTLSDYAKQHGPSVFGVGFKVKNADLAFQLACEKGANPFSHKTDRYPFPAIVGIAGNPIYFVDDENFSTYWQTTQKRDVPPQTNLTVAIDHITYNVKQGEMDIAADFLQTVFGFQEIRSFHIQGQQTGLVSRAMGSPCGNIRIPINEATDAKSQIAEFIDSYNGGGVQHIALATQDIYQAVEAMAHNALSFLTVPGPYYDALDKRIPWHQEPLSRLAENQILLDGGKTKESGLLLQIFTEPLFGPVFFEIIQRKGNDGFGEGNFQALFEAMEQDQIRRGVL